MEIPIQAARRNDDTFLLKFRPTIAADYSIILKDFIEQPLPGKTQSIQFFISHFLRLGCPFIFPVYNPNAVHVDSFNRLQPINNCHLICKLNLKLISKILIFPFR
jgi:hypothetical protein